ncbi:glycosyltransferase family 2 protein [Demequina maris]|uniref:glycosyltransferase family 2 protein n=1 Tax=Demequina maris TaxID=1638982 RepID=UPI000785E98C|nr:glycosyltransferase family 2 protein [Demequina maris]
MPAHELAVVIAAHNAGAFLRTSLASMARESRDGVQWIVVDDASTDTTAEQLERAAATVPHLTVLTNETNLGVAASRNRAHREVDARYLTYLDADDWYGPRHLERMLEAIRRLDVDFVRCDHTIVSGIDRQLSRVPEMRREVAHPTASSFGFLGERSALNYLYIWAGVYDLERIDLSRLEFDTSLWTASDRPWMWQLYLHAESTAVVPLNGYFYRKSTNQTALTQAGNVHTLDFIGASESITALAVASGNERAVDRAVHSAMFLVDFHLERETRLSPELRALLRERAADMLAAAPQDPLERALTVFDGPARRVLRGLRDKGRG